MSDTLVNGLVPFGPDANCTLALCPLEASILGYQPSLVANGVFIGVFGTIMAAHFIQGSIFKSWGFMASMLSGCVLEIVGYVGRVFIHDDPFDFSGFLMQISSFPVLTLRLTEVATDSSKFA